MFTRKEPLIFEDFIKKVGRGETKFWFLFFLLLRGGRKPARRVCRPGPAEPKSTESEPGRENGLAEESWLFLIPKHSHYYSLFVVTVPAANYALTG